MATQLIGNRICLPQPCEWLGEVEVSISASDIFPGCPLALTVSAGPSLSTFYLSTQSARGLRDLIDQGLAHINSQAAEVSQ